MSEKDKKSALSALTEMLPTDNSAALVTSPLSLRYLSGVTVESGLILASKEARILFVTQREFERLGRRCEELTVTALNESGQILDVLIKYGIKKVYIEADKMTVAQYNLYKERLHYAQMDTSGALDNAISELRSVKREDELAAIANAQKVCDKAYERLLGSLRK